MLYVLLYLSAVIAANLSVAAFGPPSVYVNAFLFIGLTLTTRDRLHEYWRGKHLFIKMGALILAGALLSWLVNRNAGAVALASVIAFLAAECIDTFAFYLLRHRSWMVRVNGSNVPSALVDSLVFPTIAFGSFFPAVVVGQFVAKFIGGFVWSLVIRRWGAPGVSPALAARWEPS